MMSLDTQLLYLLNNMAGQSLSLDLVIIYFAKYLPYILVVIFLAYLVLSQYSKKEKLQIFFLSIISTVTARFGVTELVRLFYQRQRPFAELPVNQLLTSNEWSFPSGHAAFFFALSTVVYIYNKKWGIGFFIATFLMSISRIASGIHYPSDIVGGAVVGVGTACAIWYLVHKVNAVSPTETTIQPVDK